MRKSSNQRRRSSSQPGRLSEDRNKKKTKESLDSLIPKPRMRSISQDPLNNRKTSMKTMGITYFFNL